MADDADRDLATRARILRAALDDEAALREHTGETDIILAYIRWSGQAGFLLGELADRLDGDIGSAARADATPARQPEVRQ